MDGGDSGGGSKWGLEKISHLQNGTHVFRSTPLRLCDLLIASIQQVPCFLTGRHASRPWERPGTLKMGPPRTPDFAPNDAGLDGEKVIWKRWMESTAWWW